MHLLPRITGAAIVSAALLLSTGVAAHAQSETVKDTSSDVLSFVDHQDENGTVLGYGESTVSGVDLRSLRVDTKKSVSVNVKFSRLSEDTTVIVAFRLNGSSKLTRLLYNTWDDQGQILNSRGTRRCKVPLTTRVGKGGSVNAVIKRGCLGDPKKLKATVSALSPGAFEENQAHVAGIISPTALRSAAWTTWLTAS